MVFCLLFILIFFFRYCIVWFVCLLVSSLCSLCCQGMQTDRPTGLVLSGLVWTEKSS